MHICPSLDAVAIVLGRHPAPAVGYQESPGLTENAGLAQPADTGHGEGQRTRSSLEGGHWAGGDDILFLRTQCYPWVPFSTHHIHTCVYTHRHMCKPTPVHTPTHTCVRPHGPQTQTGTCLHTCTHTRAHIPARTDEGSRPVHHTLRFLPHRGRAAYLVRQAHGSAFVKSSKLKLVQLQDAKSSQMSFLISGLKCLE